MTKIVFLTQRLPFPPNKGEKIRTYNQIKYLNNLNYKICVAWLEEIISNRTDLLLFNKLFSFELLSTKLLNRMSSYTKSIIAKRPLSVGHFYNPILQNKIQNTLTLDADIIFCSSSSMYEYVQQSNALKTKAIIIVDFMDLDSDKWKQYRDSSWGIKKWVYNREYKLLKEYEKLIQKRADYCLFTTDKEVALFKKNIDKGISTDNLITIGNGLDREYFQPINKAFNASQPTFIFTGVMDYKPNVDAVMWFCESIWKEVLALYPNAKFIIAGMNPTANVKNLAKLQGVEVTGFVEDIRDYYQQADVFVAPLQIARGVQNKVLEAFACNLPVITTANAIQGIDCEPEEHCLQATTVEEFISQIQRLITDKELREQISENALQLIIDKYSWEGQLQKLDKLINSDLTKEKRS